MKISTNTLSFINKHYQSAGAVAVDGHEALLKRIGAQLAGVEEVTDYGKRFQGVLITRVMSSEDHPDADRLHVCKIDDGGKAAGVERDEKGFVQVVCGAPNVREGLTVAWLPPGATVPSTLDKDPFVLEARALRGVMSNGMLASPKELTIGDSHEGILELDTDAAPGTAFGEAYGLQDDVIIDMENKMFTHRPDCFGFLGVAREIEGIHGRAYSSPAWYRPDPDLPALETDALRLEVQNEVPDLVPRFTAVVLRNVTIKASPVWLQIALSKVGVRPINNIVDYTNFFMLETGQPIHAYDYDKVVAQDDGADHATLVVRNPRQGEKITLLNGKEIEPRAEAIMIATRDKLIGVGGVMGGTATEVDGDTKNIIIEVANFDMYSIRRTSMVHGLFTDAVARFNKGQSPLQNLAVLAKITDEIRTYADGKVASEWIDDNHLADEVLARSAVHPAVSVSPEFINVRLGLSLSASEMIRLLSNVEFRVTEVSDNLEVLAPFWRTDIAIAEDIVEEIGRLYGYDHLPLVLPARDLSPTPKDAMLTLKARIRTILSHAGANELLTYSFVHGNLLKKTVQDPTQAFQLSNALSPDLQYFRMSLTPSLLEKVHPNVKAGHKQFAAYEMGKVHNLMHVDDDNGLPKEFRLLSLVFAADNKDAAAAFYNARVYLDALAEGLGTMFSFAPIPADMNDYPITAPFDRQRSALVSDVTNGIFIGIVGEFRPGVRKSLKLPEHTAGFELDLDALLEAQDNVEKYVPLPRFPKVEQDICLRVDVATAYSRVYDFVKQQVADLQPGHTKSTVSVVDIYQRPESPEHKQITLRLSLASYERTLTDEEVHSMLDQIAVVAQSELHAERI